MPVQSLTLHEQGSINGLVYVATVATGQFPNGAITHSLAELIFQFAAVFGVGFLELPSLRVQLGH